MANPRGKNTMRPFRKENVPSYLKVVGSTVLLGLVAAAVGYSLVPSQGEGGMGTAFLISGLLGAFGGMAVMFTASLLNLRKLRPGFERLARGEEPRIPSVWCPVLTTATAAAERLATTAARSGRTEGGEGGAHR